MRTRDAIAERAGRPIDLVAYASKDPPRDATLDLSKVRKVADPVALARDRGIDVFVELMGGEGDPAKSSVEAALAAGRPVVTANKALLAHHGVALAQARGDEQDHAVVRGGGRRRHPDHQDAARGARRQPHQPHLRHPQRHLQLHPHAHAEGAAVLRRMPEGSAEARLCRGRSDLRHRRLRHRAQDRDPDQPRLRHRGRCRGGACGRHRVDHARRSRSRRRARLSREAPRRRAAHRRRHRAARASDHGAQGQRDRRGRRRAQCGGGRCRHHGADADGAGRRRRRDLVGGGGRHHGPCRRPARAVVRAAGREPGQGAARADAAPRGRLLHPACRGGPARNGRDHRAPHGGGEYFAGIDHAARPRPPAARRRGPAQRRQACARRVDHLCYNRRRGAPGAGRDRDRTAWWRRSRR